MRIQSFVIPGTYGQLSEQLIKTICIHVKLLRQFLIINHVGISKLSTETEKYLKCRTGKMNSTARAIAHSMLLQSVNDF